MVQLQLSQLRAVVLPRLLTLLADIATPGVHPYLPLQAFLEGFWQLVPRELIAIFNDHELELLISGLPDIDVGDLRANTNYSGYSPASPVIQWFWQVVSEMEKQDLALLLQFVTGRKAGEGDGRVAKEPSTTVISPTANWAKQWADDGHNQLMVCGLGVRKWCCSCAILQHAECRPSTLGMHTCLSPRSSGHIVPHCNTTFKNPFTNPCTLTLLPRCAPRYQQGAPEWLQGLAGHQWTTEVPDPQVVWCG